MSVHRVDVARLAGYVRQAVSVLGIVALSVVSTLAVQRLLAPPPASAQPAQFEEVRAGRFVLVGADGTMLARLDPGGDGNGRLQLFDARGPLRLVVAGQGSFIALDPDGTTVRFRAGYVPYVDASGRAPINGVWLDPEGSLGTVPPGTIQR
jgi:hypothetical protein